MITLQNQSKKLYIVSGNRYFKPNDSIAFDDKEAKRLLRYEGIVSLADIAKEAEAVAEKAIETAEKADKKAKKAKKAKSKVEESFDYDSASDEDKASADAAIEADNKE
jgi:ribosomal protein L17